MKAIQRCAALLLFCAPILAQGYEFGCRDEKATYIPEEIIEPGYTLDCEASTELWGFELTLRFDCPPWRILVPAHQECQGDFLWGHYCTIDKALELEYYVCDCNLEGSTDDLLSGNGCNCEYVSSAGQVEDFATKRCELY